MVVTSSPSQLAKDWAKGYTSQPNEYEYEIQDIDGEIPSDLQGTLFRNGPGLFEIGGKTIGHIFDADGMLRVFRFQEGKIYFQNRYVRTEGYLKEQEAKTILYRGFGTQKSGGWFANFFNTNFKNAANTNVIYWGEKLWTMWEGGYPHQLNPETLETIGLDNLNGLLNKETFSAHPRIIDDIFINFGVSGITPQTLTIWELNQKGKKITSSSYPVDGFSILHDFLVTPNYYIFIKHPFKLNPLPWLLGFKSLEQCLTFDNKNQTKILIISRKSDTIEVLETEAFFGFHHGNAWESEDKIYLTTICSDSFPQREKDKMELDKMSFDKPIFGQLWQLTLDLTSKKVTRQPLVKRSCDFPSVHPAFVGQKNRYLYLNVASKVTNQAPIQSIMKYDQSNGQYQMWNPGERSFAGEPVFVPRQGTIEEDNGYLLSVVYDACIHRSYLVILDAKNLSSPLAQCYLTHHLPQGFHGTWTSKNFLK
ncbi:carotenoid oxygenase family protein [Crocosphaera chwakensis]|uniref:Beta-carotene 15,15'-dioxygenase n=1 Tax=Crocosphaera chwakensis CCY0110 TaxID=391612 RepID=A3ILA8_9CHRO|nr:carotenoid oxygenase family protein [Crocosphaera chwakensis]EAZ92559.1 Beta-carotene 15,15'-dioxygenase [Crocosphaera chwakensis CCY0110]